MTKKTLLATVLKLDIPERILLVEDIWDSIVATPSVIKLTTSQKKELDRRLASFQKNPTLGSPWNQVKKRILKQG